MNDAITLPERDTEHERVLGIVFNLSPTQARLLSCLSRATIAKGDELLAYTGIKANVKVAVSHTRAKLREKNFDIKSKIGVGYWIDPEDKAGIEEEVQKFIQGV